MHRPSTKGVSRVGRSGSDGASGLFLVRLEGHADLDQARGGGALRPDSDALLCGNTGEVWIQAEIVTANEKEIIATLRKLAERNSLPSSCKSA